MEAAASATVSTGPPPGTPPEPAQLNGSTAVTEQAMAPPPGSALPSIETAGEVPPTGAPTAQPEGAQAQSATAHLALQLNPALDDAPMTPEPFDVFADTDASATPPSSSRHYGEDGDAVMAGEVETVTPQAVFTSQLQREVNTDVSMTEASPPCTPPRTPKRAHKKPPPAPKKPRQGKFTGTSNSRAGRPAEPSSASRSRESQSPVWSRQGAAALRATLSGHRTRPTHQPAGGDKKRVVNPALEVYYATAREPANTRFDGDQRAMTKLEQETLFKWMDRQIHLEHPPNFITETHTSTERDALADFYWDHLGFRLYGILPAGCTLSEENAKYHFCFTALLGSSRDPAMRKNLERLFQEARVIACEAKSRIATIRFVRPEVRDSWKDLAFPFGNGSVKLEATDSLTTDLPRAGFDNNAKKLLYHVFVRTPRSHRQGEIRAIFAAAAEMPVLEVESIEASGLTDFSGHMYKITFGQITCPKALEQVRRLNVTYGDQQLLLSVQHPRAARRTPCTKCLSVRHITNECKNAHADKGLARHTATITVAPPTLPPKLTAALTPKKLDLQLGSLRQFACPEVGTRLQEEEAARLAKIESKAKRRADRAAREAAAEARAQREAKAQAAADRAEREARRSRQAHRAVAKQMRLLSNQATAAGQHEFTATVTVAPPPESSETISDEANVDGDIATLVGTDKQEESSTSTQESKAPTQASAQTSEASAQASEALEASTQASEASEASEPSEPSEASEEAEAEAVSEASTQAPETSTQAPETSTQGSLPPTASATTQESEHAGAEAKSIAENVTVTTVSETRMAGRSEAVADQTATATPGETTIVPKQHAIVLRHPRSAALNSTDEGARPAALAVVDATDTLSVTGKRTSPPSPTTSEDEREEYSKSHRLTPFESNASPIPVIDSLSDIIEKAAADTRAKRAQLATECRVDAPDARGKRQMPLSAFYAPQSLAAAQAQLDAQLEAEQAARLTRPVSYWLDSFPSPALDALLDNLRSPLAIAEWLTALHARVVETPGNGGCLYFALHGCRTRWKLTGNSISAINRATKIGGGRAVATETRHSAEANWYKKQICRKFVEYLEQMLSDGTITLTELSDRFYAQRNAKNRKLLARKAAISAITFAIEAIEAKNVSKGLDRTQWGRDEELFSTVWSTREPLFIITEDSKTKRTSVRVIWLDRPYPDGPERIIELYPDAGEAFEILRCFLRHRFLPTVLIHVTIGTDGHFNSLRFDEELYADWTRDDNAGEAMRAALVQLGWYVAPADPTDIPKASIIEPLSGSLYEASQPELQDPTPTPVSPDALLSPTSHYALLRSLNPRGRRRSALADAWAQAEGLNLIAYRTWDSDQHKEEARSEPDTVEAGCRFWSGQPSQLVSLLRALPYPEVAMSLLPLDILVRLGNELTNLAVDGAVPDFVRAADPVEACHHWARLVALVVVLSPDELIDLASVTWLCQHPTETTAALHSLRLYDWTVVSQLARPTLPTLPTHSAASGPASDTRS